MTGLDIFFDLPAELYAVHTRHHNIADDEIGIGLFGCGQAGMSIDGFGDMVLCAQAFTKELPQLIVIVYNQYMWYVTWIRTAFCRLYSCLFCLILRLNAFQLRTLFCLIVHPSFRRIIISSAYRYTNDDL